MLAGRPVVACDGLGLGEVLSGAPRTGRLVPPGDAVALARAVAELAADPAAARAVGAAGRAEALERFSPGRYRAEFVRAVLPRNRRK